MSPDTAPVFSERYTLPSRTSAMFTADVSVMMPEADVPTEYIALNTLFISSLNFAFAAIMSFATAPPAALISPLSRLSCPFIADSAEVKPEMSGVTTMS